ncbi:TatD family hydrolase [Candidatus Saccharibacteria bacterium]|nr:TatD family hydrolase [Candidatus Saccharibacteria bacterium]
MELTDTHCHIHLDNYPIELEKVISSARSAGVSRLICVGTTLADSERALEVAAKHEGVWASAGVHPHGVSGFAASPKEQATLAEMLNKSSISAIGEIGLDYYKNYAPKIEQQKAFKLQIEMGLNRGLPFIFHIREAWDDFFAIFDAYPGLTGVVHSFSAHQQQLDEALRRGLYIGLNGIMTFTNDNRQLAAAKTVPIDRLVLETDAPFLAPKPYRGQTCEPKHVLNVVEFLAWLRNEPVEALAKATTSNAIRLFKLS